MQNAAPTHAAHAYEPEKKATRRTSLKGNILWTAIGTVVFAASQWIMISALAKLTDSATVGVYALGLAIGAPVFMLLNLQLRGIQAGTVDQEYTFPDFFVLRAITSTLALVIVLAIILASSYPVGVAAAVALLAVVKVIESIGEVFHGQFQQMERMRTAAVSLALRGVAGAIAFVGVIALSGNLLIALVALAASWFTIMAVYDIRQLVKMGGMSRPGWNGFASNWPQRSRIIQLAVLAAPLGVVMGLISLNTNIPRYFIERSHGVGELGFFAAVAYLLIPNRTLIAAIGQASTPPLARYSARGNSRAFTSLVGRLAAIAFVIGAAGVIAASLIGETILALLYTDDYSSYAPTFVWVMLAAALSNVNSVFGYALTAAKYFKSQVPIFVAACVVSIIVSWMTVPTEGALGGAKALAAGFAVQTVGSALVTLLAIRSMGGYLNEP